MRWDDHHQTPLTHIYVSFPVSFFFEFNAVFGYAMVKSSTMLTALCKYDPQLFLFPTSEKEEKLIGLTMISEQIIYFTKKLNQFVHTPCFYLIVNCLVFTCLFAIDWVQVLFKFHYRILEFLLPTLITACFLVPTDVLPYLFFWVWIHDKVNNINPSKEKKPRPEKEQNLNCPRCNSTNTKFCYYNNYSLSQPRYFCKTCRRYWTEGGTLRNVPVGGGSRKNRRPQSSSSSPSSVSISKKVNPNHKFEPSNPKIYTGEDYLNLGFNNPVYDRVSSEFIKPLDQQNPNFSLLSPNPSMNLPAAMEGGDISTNPCPIMHEFKPGFKLSLDHHHHHQNGYGNFQVIQDHNFPTSRDLFATDDQEFRQLGPSSAVDQMQERRQGDYSSNGYWNGMLAGDPWWLRTLLIYILSTS